MKNMIEVKENRKRVSTFINVSVAMIICMHFLMLFIDWLQINMLSPWVGMGLVMDICRLLGCFLILVVFSKYINRLHGVHRH